MIRVSVATATRVVVCTTQEYLALWANHQRTSAQYVIHATRRDHAYPKSALYL